MVRETIQAVKASQTLCTRLYGGSNGVHHLTTTQAKKYPQIVYSVVSDVPAMSGDDKEIMRRVTLRFHIITLDGDYMDIAKALETVMQGKGWRRRQTVEQLEDGQKILTIDYVNVGDSF